MAIPTPAIPNPLSVYNTKMSAGLLTIPRVTMTNGLKNSSNMKLDLSIILKFPNLLIPLLLKYSATRDFSVEEKSESTDFENESFLIIKIFNSTFSLNKF